MHELGAERAEFMKDEGSFDPTLFLFFEAVTSYLEPRLLLSVPSFGLSPADIDLPDDVKGIKQRSSRKEVIDHFVQDFEDVMENIYRLKI